MAEVLSGGGSDGPVRPRRWPAVAAVLAFAAVVVLQARRVDPVPVPPPPPRPVAAAPGQTSVVSVAVGARWTYALVSVCDGRIVHQCDDRVYRRDPAQPGWRPLPMHVTGRTTVGLDVTLRVTGNDRIALIQRNERVVSSPDGGVTVTSRSLLRGAPIAALPAGGIVADGLCDGCDEQVTVLDPDTGEVHPLATQPAFQGFGLRLARAEGNVLWVAQIGPAAAGTAVSPDGGRSWRTVPVARGLLRTGPVVLAAGPRGGAYLVGRRDDAELPDVRRIDGPGGSWQRLTPPTGPESAYSAVVDERGLLVSDGAGKAWRLMDGGDFLQLPGTPGFLAGGPGRLLAGLPPTPGTVQFSSDGGVTWRVEKIL